MEFYSEQKNQLDTFLKDDTIVRNAVIWGNVGLGKSKIIKEVITKLTVIIITFEKEFCSPFGYIKKGEHLPLSAKREEIVLNLSKSYTQNDCIVYENFEYCDKDSYELIKQVIHFHQENGMKAVSIIELNSECKPNYVHFNNIIYIQFNKLTDVEINTYIKSIVKATNKKHLAYICKQLSLIADGNLLALQLAKNILVQIKILAPLENGIQFNYRGDEFSDNLLLLYINLFKTLDNHIQEALRTIASFEDNIHIDLLKSAFSNCKLIDVYLDEISKYQSFILRRQSLLSTENSQANYFFPIKEAKDAITESTPEEFFYQVTTQLYHHLEYLYKHSLKYTEIREADNIYLLTLLTKIRNQNLTINHLPYFVELMKYYSEHSSYGAVIQQAEYFLEVNILSHIQINKEQPLFFRLYFRALLAIGLYDKIIQYLDKLPDWDIKLIIAYAYYNNGNPQRALVLCKEIEQQYNCGEVYSLVASIYDWMGDNKRSLSAFKNALLYVSNNNELKYTLFKKYSLYVDFELPECQEKMFEAMQYYKNTSMRQYAETLHNYGTELVMILSDESIKYLEETKEILFHLCEKEIYYPLNSIAIYKCLCGNYSSAINIWEKINTQYIQIDFCRLAILNNLFCAYIKNNSLDLAKNMKKQLEHQLDILVNMKKPKQIYKERPDIQHQVRQFFLNCALLNLAQNNENNALSFLTLAWDCSKYNSTMLYLIQNLINKMQKNKTLLKTIHNKIKQRKLGCPNNLEKFFVKKQMYFCVIMFWGDY